MKNRSNSIFLTFIALIFFTGMLRFVSAQSSSVGSTVTISKSNLPSSTYSCPLLTDYLKFEAKNNPSQVTKLQTFLKNHEGAILDINGVYDLKTMNAVVQFQRKYMADILGPWSATKPSGQVYITTLKKINQLACNNPVTLSQQDLSTINSYKQNQSAVQTGATSPMSLQSSSSPNVASGNSGQSTSNPGVSSSGTSVNNTDTSGMDNVSAQNEYNSNVAAASGSIASRFWDFLKGLFK